MFQWLLVYGFPAASVVLFPLFMIRHRAAGTSEFAEVMSCCLLFPCMTRMILRDPASYFDRRKNNNYTVSKPSAQVPFKHNGAGSVPKVFQICPKSVQSWLKIAQVRNMRNLILAEYGKHIGVTTGGHRHHITSIITKTMPLWSTKSPQMIPNVQNYLQKGSPKSGSNRANSTTNPHGYQNRPKFIKMLSEYFQMAPRLFQIDPKWLPELFPKADKQKSRHTDPPSDQKVTGVC